MSKDRAIKTLESFRLLEHDWDGYGGEPFEDELIDKCIKIVKKLTYTPNVYPTFRNSIQLEYSVEQKYLEIEIYEDNCMLLVMDGGKIIKEREIEENVITKAVDRFHGIA